MTSSIRYDESFPLDTLDASDAPPYIAPKKTRTALIVGIIIGVILLIIIIVIVVVLVSRSRAAAAAKPPPTTGGGTTPGSTTCTTDSQCSAPKVCNTSTQRCVDCNTNSQCTGSAFPFCKAETSTCVRCLTTPDCNSPTATCSANLCCDTTPPVINNVTTTISEDSRIQVNLEIKQPVATSKSIVVLEDPTGYPLLSQTCSDATTSGAIITCKADGNCPAGDRCVNQKCEIRGCLTFAAGPFILLTESAIGMKIFPQTPYKIKVKTVYDCGAIKNASTEFSQTRDFTTVACPTSPVTRVISSVEEIVLIIPNGQIVQLLITLPTPNSAPNFLVGFVASTTSGIHPNRAEIYVPSVQTMNGRDGLKVAMVDDPGPGTFYARAFSSGGPDECDGPLGPQFKFVTQGYVPSLRVVIPPK